VHNWADVVVVLAEGNVPAKGEQMTTAAERAASKYLLEPKREGCARHQILLLLYKVLIGDNFKKRKTISVPTADGLTRDVVFCTIQVGLTEAASKFARQGFHCCRDISRRGNSRLSLANMSEEQVRGQGLSFGITINHTGLALIDHVVAMVATDAATVSQELLLQRKFRQMWEAAFISANQEVATVELRQAEANRSRIEGELAESANTKALTDLQQLVVRLLRQDRREARVVGFLHLEHALKHCARLHKDEMVDLFRVWRELSHMYAAGHVVAGNFPKLAAQVCCGV
jgi:hypothetical protein